jgi:hypothetical protein
MRERERGSFEFKNWKSDSFLNPPIKTLDRFCDYEKNSSKEEGMRTVSFTVVVATLGDQKKVDPRQFIKLPHCFSFRLKQHYR